MGGALQILREDYTAGRVVGYLLEFDTGQTEPLAVKEVNIGGRTGD